jgi:hypothetical protein
MCTHMRVSTPPPHLAVPAVCRAHGVGKKYIIKTSFFNAAPYSSFFRKEQPSVNRALPPVGWQSMTAQEPQTTT